MAYRATRYQVTATKTSSGQEIIVGYTSRVSKSGLLKLMQRHSDFLINLTSITDEDQITFHTKPRIHAFVKGWKVGFIGKTEKHPD